MDERTQELLDRLVAPGQFPNMSCSEGHELHEGVMDELDTLDAQVESLTEWKRQQLQVEGSWNPQEVAIALNLHLGADIRKEILPKIEVLKAENKRLKELLSASEDYRRAYADGKYKLYEMGGEICEAAAKHLPMSEGPLDRAVRKALDS